MREFGFYVEKLGTFHYHFSIVSAGIRNNVVGKAICWWMPNETQKHEKGMKQDEAHSNVDNGSCCREL